MREIKGVERARTDQARTGGGPRVGQGRGLT
jgi:hypothetical protein